MTHQLAYGTGIWDESYRRVCSCAGVYVGCVEGSTKPDIYMGGVKLWFLVCRGCYSLYI